MLNDEVIQKVIERLVNRIEQGNEYLLKKIGESIAKLGELTPAKAQELVQILKYGGDFDKIVKKLEEITNLNIKDIYKIFDEVAKSDYVFAEQFYKYKELKYIPYDENVFLRRQVEALAQITANEYNNLTKTSAVAFGTRADDGTITYKGLRQTYYDLLDEAVMNVGQGKESFDQAMFRQLKEIGTGGMKVIFPSTYIGKDANGNDVIKNRIMRADSAVRLQMRTALRNLHNEVQKEIGKEIDADGIEISVHLNPAPDHAEVQGRQFTNEEFDKFQNDQDAKDYKGRLFTADFEGRDRRAISEYNCYHYIFSIVLGVNEPQYNDEELKQIIKDNEKGFEFDGKHYTNYEGTQLQREIERAIREQKDFYIISKASDNVKGMEEAGNKIRVLTKKYKELSEISGLKTKMKRLRVSGYKK